MTPYVAALQTDTPSRQGQRLAKAESSRPQFSDFPVESIYRGKPAPPIITKDWRNFRTMIRLGAASAVNFAGRYTVPSWGCGAGCNEFVVVDSRSGVVYDGLLVVELPPAWEEHHEDSETVRMEFHPNSRLLKINACPNEENCGLYDYVMIDGKGLKLIHKELLPKEYQPPPVLLQDFLQNYVGTSDGGKGTRYFAASVSLRDDDTRYVIVYLTEDGWCGSGGCTTLILERNGFNYRVVTKVTVSRPPVRVLNTKTNGWHDISVVVQGGGIVQSYEAKLSFNGKSYPVNPTVPPAQPLTTGTAGEVVVPMSASGEPLYPPVKDLVQSPE